MNITYNRSSPIVDRFFKKPKKIRHVDNILIARTEKFFIHTDTKMKYRLVLVVSRIFLFPGTCIHTTGPQKTRQILRKAQKIRHVDSINFLHNTEQ